MLYDRTYLVGHLDKKKTQTGVFRSERVCSGASERVNHSLGLGGRIGSAFVYLLVDCSQYRKGLLNIRSLQYSECDRRYSEYATTINKSNWEHPTLKR